MPDPKERPMDRLPVDVFAAATFGALLGAVFAILDGPGGDLLSNAGTGSLLFGGLGAIRWMKRLSSRSGETVR